MRRRTEEIETLLRRAIELARDDELPLLEYLLAMAELENAAPSEMAMPMAKDAPENTTA